MKNNDVGRATIKLIIAIIIIIIIAFAGVNLIKRILIKNNEKNIKTDLLYIQAKCKVIYDKHIINQEEPLIGEKIEEYNENEIIDNIIKTSEKEWYKLNQEDLDKIGEGHLKETDGYIVNYETEEVIYATGITNNDETLYTLTEILNNTQEINTKVENQETEESKEEQEETHEEENKEEKIEETESE